jgi:hypothetical protein
MESNVLNTEVLPICTKQIAMPAHVPFTIWELIALAPSLTRLIKIKDRIAHQEAQCK